MTKRTGTITPSRILGAAGLALAVALAGCAEATPAQEVRSGRSGSVTTVVATGVTVPSNPTSSAPSATSPADTSPAEPGSVDPSPPLTGGGQPPAGETLPPVTTIPGDPRQPHRWEGYTVGADGITLTFTYYAGVEPCSVFDSIVAEEGADSVRVSIYEHAGPGETMCIMIAQLKSATVTLSAPLDGRALVDGAA